MAGISGFREPFVSGRNPSADVLYRWVEQNNFVWLVTEDILDEYKEVLKRLGVRPVRPPECVIVPPRTPLLLRTTKGRSESAQASINSSQCCFASDCTRGRHFDEVHSFPTSRSLWDSSEEMSEMGRSLMASE